MCGDASVMSSQQNFPEVPVSITVLPDHASGHPSGNMKSSLILLPNVRHQAGRLALAWMAWLDVYIFFPYRRFISCRVISFSIFIMIQKFFHQLAQSKSLWYLTINSSLIFCLSICSCSESWRLPNWAMMEEKVFILPSNVIHDPRAERWVNDMVEFRFAHLIQGILPQYFRLFAISSPFFVNSADGNSILYFPAGTFGRRLIIPAFSRVVSSSSKSFHNLEALVPYDMSSIRKDSLGVSSGEPVCLFEELQPTKQQTASRSMWILILCIQRPAITHDRKRRTSCRAEREARSVTL